MSKDQALQMIDAAKAGIINPVELLNWVWLRLFIVSHTEEEFDAFMQRVADTQ